MREFQIQTGSEPEFVRAIVGGLPSSGKTHFAATAPRPLFISDAAEGGFKTLQQMNSIYWWDPAVPPEVWALERMEDIGPACSRLEKMALEGKLPFKTLVFDPISIYVDRVLAELQLKNPGQDNRRTYGDLANHLRALILRLHALPMNVLWLTHVRTGADVSGPSIGGSMGEKFPAFCDFKWLCHVNAVPGKDPEYELHTAPFRLWSWLGGRWLLPDPIVPSFKCVAQILNMRERPVSPAIPGFPEGATYNWPQQQ